MAHGVHDQNKVKQELETGLPAKGDVALWLRKKWRLGGKPIGR